MLAACGSSKREVSFEKHVLDDRFLSEGVAVFDVDGDGLLDIVSNEQWFRAPQFEAHAIGPVTPLDPATQFSDSFANFPMDVDGDGLTDLVVFGFPIHPAVWRKNPGGGDVMWAEYPVWGVAPDQSPVIAAIAPTLGDTAIFIPDGNEIGIYARAADPTAQWVARRMLPLPPAVMPFDGHGLGIGNIDGGLDLVTTRGYWSMPASIDDPWPFTAVDLGPDCAQMYVLDVDHDGLPDVVSSSAHEYGVFWHQQQADGSFVMHTIFDQIPQTHALAVADIDGDGLPDLVTGKRWYPDGDLAPDGPRDLYWFEQDPASPTQFVPHLIDDDSGVGTQFVIVDVDGDGRLDIVTANKRGTFYFRQR
jgi:hypothetical protein